MKNKQEEIIFLTKELNKHCDLYYNQNAPMISDYEYDCMFDRLKSLEEETGFYITNSPTRRVGYEVVSDLKKVKHNHPMLSLDKTKSVKELSDFIGDNVALLMLKMDGLTVSLSYKHGDLVSAETRGNGEIGEDVLHTVKTFSNVPLRINCEEDLIIDGEAIIPIDVFDKINEPIPKESRYKNIRNLASGSVRQLDSSVSSQRGLKFVAWKVVKGLSGNSFSGKLNQAEDLGFEIVPFKIQTGRCEFDKLECTIELLRNEASSLKYPIDGIVAGYDDIAAGEALGQTGHHIRSQIAFKFYDEEEVTQLREVEWSMGRTGVLTPVAIFDQVEIDGTDVSRASVHNVSIFKELALGYGDELTVYKSNQIIPQVRENLTKSGTCEIPEFCPVCGEALEIVKDNDTEVLMCKNTACGGKLLGKLSNFVERNAMNIEGLSSASLERFIDSGWLNRLSDIFALKEHFDDMVKLDGYGEKSSQKICEAIEKSKNCTLTQFLTACGIPGIGKSQAKLISKYYGTWEDFIEAVEMDPEDLLMIDGIGKKIMDNIIFWRDTDYINDGIPLIAKELTFIDEKSVADSPISGKVFCITGSLTHFTNRDTLVKNIELNGGRVSGSVSAKTDFLISNEKSGKSSKIKKALSLGIKIISEEEYKKILS